MFERKVKGDKLLVIAGMVFNISSWIRDHPGGEHVLLRSLSQDVTVQFQRVHAMSAHHKLVDLYECDLVDGSGASAPSPASALTSTGSLGAHPPPSPISLGLSSPIMRLPMLSPASSLKPTSPLLPLPRSVEVSKEIRNVDILSSQLGTPRSLSAAARAPPPPSLPSPSACPFMALANVGEQNGATPPEGHLHITDRGSPVPPLDLGKVRPTSEYCRLRAPVRRYWARLGYSIHLLSPVAWVPERLDACVRSAGAMAGATSPEHRAGRLRAQSRGETPHGTAAAEGHLSPPSSPSR